MKDLNQGIGYDAPAYARREGGYSPDTIRDAIWNLLSGQISGSILDAGSGNGGWIKRLKALDLIEQIFSVDIVDDGASEIDGVEFHIVDVSTSSLPCQDYCLDWIFATEVIEHLANPRNFIQEASRCLKMDGKLVISTPSNESIRAKTSFLLRGYYPAFCDHDYHTTGHITPILEIDLKRMASEAGFKSVEEFYVVDGLIPGSSISWQKVFPWLKGKLWSDTMIAVLTK